jgi:hypothetical protein
MKAALGVRFFAGAAVLDAVAMFWFPCVNISIASQSFPPLVTAMLTAKKPLSKGALHFFASKCCLF